MARKRTPEPPPEPSDAEKLTTLRTRLIDSALRLEGQLFHATVRKEVKVTSLGEGVTEAEVIVVELDEPTFSDKKLIVGSIDGLIKEITALTPGHGLAGGAPAPDPDAPDDNGEVSDFERAKQEREARRAAAQAVQGS